MDKIREIRLRSVCVCVHDGNDDGYGVGDGGGDVDDGGEKNNIDEEKTECEKTNRKIENRKTTRCIGTD